MNDVKTLGPQGKKLTCLSLSQYPLPSITPSCQNPLLPVGLHSLLQLLPSLAVENGESIPGIRGEDGWGRAGTSQ